MAFYRQKKREKEGASSSFLALHLLLKGALLKREEAEREENKVNTVLINFCQTFFICNATQIEKIRVTA